MKVKTKILVSSIAAMMTFSAVAVGGTYSLFTSKDGADIAVTAGKVQVKAAIKGVKATSGEWDETGAEYKAKDVTASGKFANGGSWSVDGGSVSLERLTPMDKLEFSIEVENLSNVAVKYRTRFSAPGDDGLLDGLKVTVDSAEFSGMTTFTPWASWASAGKVEISVSVELPESAGDVYQEKACELLFAVEAVQGNAHVEDIPSNEIWLYTPSDLRGFSRMVNKSTATTVKDVILMDDIDMKGMEIESIGSLNHSYELKGTFDGQGHTISNAVIKGIDDKGTGLFGSSANQHQLTIKDLTLKNSKISGEKNVGGILGMGYTADIENCHVEGCEITSIQKRAAGICANMPSDGSIKNCSSKNNIIACAGEIGTTDGPADIISYYTAGTTQEDNTFSGNELKSV